MTQNQNNRGRYTHQQNFDNNSAHVQPQAPDIEKLVLGAQMIDKNAHAIVYGIIQNQPVYYEPRNQLIQEAIDTLVKNEAPVDIWTVTEQLNRQGNLEEVGGPSYIMELNSLVASSSRVDYYCGALQEKYRKRKFIELSSILSQKGFDNTVISDDLLDEAEGEIQLIRNIVPKKDVKSLASSLKEAIEEIQAAAANPDGITGVASFSNIDSITAGFQPSNLIIVAARPAMGKTSFALSLAKKIAVDQNIPTAIFSLEMSAVDLVKRLISNFFNISGDSIRRGQLNNDEWARVDKYLPTLINSPLYIDETSGLSIGEFRSKVKRLVRDCGVKIIFIDFLQLMRHGGQRFTNRQEEVSEISNSLESIAKELKIPIIALSQLNRGVENREGLEGKRPRLSDLRESGAIEQAADLVMFIHRPEYYHIYQDENGNDLRGMAQLIIAKHRHGATGDVLFKFCGEFTRFEDPADSEIGAPKQTSPEPVMDSKVNDTAFETDDSPLPF